LRALPPDQRMQRVQERADQRQQQRQAGELRRTERSLEQQQTRVQQLQERVQRLQAGQPLDPRRQRAQQRLLQAQERILQREQRVQQREQARLQRMQQAVQQRAPQQSLTPQAVQQPTGSVSPRAADFARGRFAERFHAAHAEAPRHDFTARQAFRRGLKASFVPWVGHVYWPYAYHDIFEYTFWPAAYEEGYWAYAYDEFVETVFWGPARPSRRYSAIETTGTVGYGPDEPRRGRSSTRAPVSDRTLQQLCGDPDQGITAWPFADIERAVQPTPEQGALLEQMKQAAAQAADAYKASCAGTFPMTPPGRLNAMLRRIDATLAAVRIVRPALERFYESLTDEQKARFNALGPNMPDRRRDQAQQDASACADSKPSLTNLPIERIEATVRPTDRQRDALERLRDATMQAVQALQSACPDDIPQTPIGRLEAIEKRIEAMAQAGKLVQPALETFYGSLSNEQKARFNGLGMQAGR
jgi:hypothetical protein